MPKSVTRTVRLDKDLDDAIQRRAEEEKITVNFLVNRTVRKLVEWDIPARKFGLVIAPEGLLSTLIDRYDDESCIGLGRASAREYIKPFAANAPLANRALVIASRGQRVVNKATKKDMKKILSEIQQGKFARQWISETKTGRKKYSKLLKADLTHPIEKVGAQLRARMPWLESGKA